MDFSEFELINTPRSSEIHDSQQPFLFFWGKLSLFGGRKRPFETKHWQSQNQGMWTGSVTRRNLTVFSTRKKHGPTIRPTDPLKQMLAFTTSPSLMVGSDRSLFIASPWWLQGILPYTPDLVGGFNQPIWKIWVFRDEKWKIFELPPPRPR